MSKNKVFELETKVNIYYHFAINVFYYYFIFLISNKMDFEGKLEQMRELIAKIDVINEGAQMVESLKIVNESYISTCDEYNLADDQEQTEHKRQFIHLSLQYQEHQTKMIAKLSAKFGEKEQMVMDEDGAASESLQFKDYALMLKPLFDLARIETINEKAINEVVCAIVQVKERAKELGTIIDDQEKTIIAYIQNLMDVTTKVLWNWELQRATENPTIDLLIGFLVARAANINPEEINVNQASGSEPKKQRWTCIRCQGNHPLHRCEAFNAMFLEFKRKFVVDKGLCANCFDVHDISSCPYGECQRCQVKHNSTLCPRLKTNRSKNN